MHYYVFLRLARTDDLPAPFPLVVAVLLATLGLSIFPAFARALPKRALAILEEVSFTWIGVLLLFDAVLFAGDLVRFGLVAVLPAHLATPELLLDASRAQALGAVVVVFVLSVVAWRSAHRDPPVVEVPVEIERWPRELSGFRIVQLSDIHVSAASRPEAMQHLVERVNDLTPDLIVLTGDLVDGPPSLIESAVVPFGGLSARLGVYFVTGNHELYAGFEAWANKLARLGLRVLENERVTVRDKGAAFELAGVPDWTAGRLAPGQRPRLSEALQGRDARTPVILLAHNPRQFAEAARLGVSLQLSGHTHGGQLWPFTLVVRLVERYLAGLHRLGASQLYVSRGTRYWGPPMRLCAPHELTVLRLETA